MIINISRKTVARRADEVVTTVNMFPNIIFLLVDDYKYGSNDCKNTTAYRVEHLLCHSNSNPDSNPVSRGRTNEFVVAKTPGREPLIDCTNAPWMRSDKVFDLLLSQMLPVTFVVRVADFVEMPFQFTEIRLRKRNLQKNFVIWGRPTMLYPSKWCTSGFFHRVCPAIFPCCPSNGKSYERWDQQRTQEEGDSHLDVTTIQTTENHSLIAYIFIM